MRKLAREAVIFTLLAFVLGAVWGVIQQLREHRYHARLVAEQAVFAVDTSASPPGFVPANTVLVPLTDGTQLHVLDCVQLHPKMELPALSPQLPAGTMCKDSVYFNDWFKQFGGQQGQQGHITEVPLGSVNQLAIEKHYWQVYKDYEARGSLGWEIAGVALLLGAIGASAGLALWVFYRLVRFAVKG
jgi:hypothetical protein